jgi:hypothetical protein
LLVGHVATRTSHFSREAIIAKNRNTYAKRQREQEKRQRADDKRAKKEHKKDKPDLVQIPPSQADSAESTMESRIPPLPVPR